jgi:hypothetical protein
MIGGSGLLAVMLVSLGVSATPARAQLQEAAFPHETHQGLFPLCIGCHEGIPAGDRADYYPEPSSCRGCHDGVREPLISWDGPTTRTTNLSFVHDVHDDDLSAAGDTPLDCASCHIAPGGQRMAVADEIQLQSCWGCHEATEHQVDADCATCHVPLARTAFDRAQIEALPVPADHQTAAFADGEHGILVESNAARCATCHTQERCVACHVDTQRDAIVAFPAAPPGMDLPAAVAHYNEPSTHLAGRWLTLHGVEASRVACATCHTQNDCTTCHVQPVPDAVRSMPLRSEVVAPGVMVRARAPESHESVFFPQAHAGLSAAGDASCTTCHQETFCVSCHDGPVGGGYHETDFLARHAANAFGRDTECASCHNTQVFCRECHVQVGLVGSGRLGPGYHDDGPAWLLRHPQAARQNLESCASCHRQVDCTQCHGVLGAFKVSPHSSGFDAERAWARSPRTCLACHVGNPLNE